MIMSNIVTTIEQSKHLLELGLDPASADMEYCYIDEFNSGLQVKGDINAEVDRRLDMMFGVTHIPAWSLSALLEVMPSFIDYKGQKLRLTIEKAGVWNVFYIGTQHRLNEIWFNGEYGDSVEPAYKMVCWLLEQGFIKKGGKL